MTVASGIQAVLEDAPSSLVRPGMLRFWKSWQIAWVVGRSAFLVSFFALMYSIRQEQTSLLLTTSVGLRMLLAALVILLIGTALELVLFAILNRREKARPYSGRLWRTGLLAIGELTLNLFFYLPAFFVMAAGPAAISISETMQKMHP